MQMTVGVQEIEMHQSHHACSDAAPAVQYDEPIHVRSPAVYPRRVGHGQGPDLIPAFGLHHAQDHHRVIPLGAFFLVCAFIVVNTAPPVGQFAGVRAITGGSPVVPAPV